MRNASCLLFEALSNTDGTSLTRGNDAKRKMGQSHFSSETLAWDPTRRATRPHEARCANTTPGVI